MALGRALVNLPGLPFGRIAEIPDEDAARWFGSGYVERIAKKDAAGADVVEDAPALAEADAPPARAKP